MPRAPSIIGAVSASAGRDGEIAPGWCFDLPKATRRRDRRRPGRSKRWCWPASLPVSRNQRGNGLTRSMRDVAHLPVVNHGERGLHAVEITDHRHQAGRDEDLIQHVGLVWRNDRYAEDLAEASGENEQPDQRPYQGRDEAFTLVQEAQRLAPGDAVQANEVLAGREAATADDRTGAHRDASPITEINPLPPVRRRTRR